MKAGCAELENQARGQASRQPIRRRDLDSARVRTRHFGDTDLEVSEIGFGTWALGSTWWGDVSESSGERLLGEALELGITFFETGDAYGQGANEELVGRVLAPHRDRIQALHQVRLRPREGRQQHSEGERPQRWDGPFIRAPSRRACGACAPTTSTSTSSTTRAWRRSTPTSASRPSRSSGTRARSATTGSPSGPRSAGARRGSARSPTRDIASVQTVYNLLEQDPGRDLMAAAAEQGVGVMARVPDLIGAAGRQPDARDHLRPRRPPPPPPAGVAGGGPAEDRPDSVPVRGRRPAAPWRRRRSASSSRSPR